MGDSRRGRRTAVPTPEADAALLREARDRARAEGTPTWSSGDSREVNPTLRLVELSWKHLPEELADVPGRVRPEPGEAIAVVWKHPWSGEARVRTAGNADLLALKLVVEGIDLREAAAAGSLTPEAVERTLLQAEDQGLLLAPRPLLRRPADFPRGAIADERFFCTSGFTLQWHLTQACDLRCRHCYDRSDRARMPLGDALRVLDDLRAFCRERRVRGAVTLSGGNPLLHPHFLEIYRAATDRGFSVSILGNPAPRERIEEIAALERPYFFQVSLEGLPEHNDAMRGRGHFDRTVRFLGVLREVGVSSMVMLTLTADNLRQVLPLAERLRGFVDDFHFNRLAMVGEGAALRLPSREEYARFLEEYLEASESDPALGIKDNLINILLRERGEAPFGGCTGFGCGAAFNFLALLPDGEAHACRKFPSPVGNALREGIAAVYDGEAARRYRAGCAGCGACDIRPVCGGCLAVAHGFGLDASRERDPMCFVDRCPPPRSRLRGRRSGS